jgi:dienelactone hydrolase
MSSKVQLRPGGVGRKLRERSLPSAHGWTVPDSPTYNKLQAERAYKKLTDLLDSTLKRN